MNFGDVDTKKKFLGEARRRKMDKEREIHKIFIGSLATPEEREIHNSSIESLTTSEERETLDNYSFADQSFDVMEKFRSDVSLKVKGKIFHAHKHILSSQSPVFRAIFKDDNSAVTGLSYDFVMIEENKTGSVIIKGIDPAMFKEILRFIYTGRINEIEKAVFDLIITADLYELDSLKDFCVKFLLDTMSIENFIKYFEFSDRYNLSELKKKVLDFMVKHSKEVVAEPEFKEMCFKKPNVMYECLLAFANVYECDSKNEQQKK